MQARDVWLLMAAGAALAVIGIMASLPALVAIGVAVAVVGFVVWQVTARRAIRRDQSGASPRS